MKNRETQSGSVIHNAIGRGFRAALCLLLVVQMIILAAVPAFAAGDDDVVLVTAPAPNVYSDAGTGYSSAGSAVGGVEYTFLSQATGTDGAQWYQIQYSDSSTGWVSSRSAVKLTAEERKDPQNGVRAIADAYGAAGVQAAIVEKGVVTRSYYSGWAVKGTRAMAEDTKIRAASLSKVIIAMTALKMQEEGIVDLNTQIGEYWNTDLPKNVTLKSLLTHTSTLRDLTPGSDASGVRAQLSSSSSYTTGTPGSASAWYYNNYGAAIAGSTLEMAANQNIDSYADSRIFNSLGIDAAWMSGRVNTTKLATLYRNDGTVGREASTSATLVGSDTPGSNAAYYAGGFTTSAADYARLIAILANDGTYAGTRYLMSDSVAQMENPFFTRNAGYASSFEQCLALRHKAGLYGQSELYYHTGNAYGMLSLASYNPSTANGVVVLTTGCRQGTDSQGIYAVCGAISRYLYDFMERQPEKHAEAIEIEEAVTLRKGETAILTAVLTPTDADSEVEWESSSPECVSVNGEGMITANGLGTAVITAKAGTVSDSCTVTVLPAEELAVDDEEGVVVGVEPTEDFTAADENNVIKGIGGIKLIVGSVDESNQDTVAEAVRNYNEFFDADQNTHAMYDISLFDKKTGAGVDVKDGGIKITLKVPDDLAASDNNYVFKLYRYGDDGTVEEISAAMTDGNSRFRFCADEFGPYVLVRFDTTKCTNHVYTDKVDGSCNYCGIRRETTEKRVVMHMFRMYDPNSGEHFYTGSEVERDNLVAAGWNYEGVGFTFSMKTGAPVYRLYEPVTGEHLYTMDEKEKADLMAAGWNLEGVAFNSAYDTEVPQYRLHNPNATRGAYHFTASEEERDILIAAGWEDQGIGFYSAWK